MQEVRWEDDIHDALRVLAASKWHEDINRRESTNGHFGNKLRTTVVLKLNGVRKSIYRL